MYVHPTTRPKISHIWNIAYVFNLQHRFPLQDAASASPAVDAKQSEPWRTRVVGLEKELHDLRAKYDSQSIGALLCNLIYQLLPTCAIYTRLELTACRITAGEASGDRESTPSCPTPTPVPNKKKSKKKASSSSALVESRVNGEHLQDTPRDTLSSTSKKHTSLLCICALDLA